MKKVQDHYFHRARKDGYVARSAYKLEEIDQRHQLLKRGQKVLDLGCAPGSWLQYTAKRIGESGRLLGIDLQAVVISLPPQVEVFQTDIYELDRSGAWWENSFDIILSDMAPQTTGIRAVDADRSYALNQHALWLAEQHLIKGGYLLVKAFQGAPFQRLQQEFQQMFAEVKICKPKSSRSESVEVFLLGKKKQESQVEEGGYLLQS